MSRTSRVVVCGGGLAGITAALAAADAGASVLLLERRGWLGGATFSFARDGLTVDNGQHVFLRCCTAYRWLLDRLGVGADALLQPRLAVPVLAPGGRTGWLRRGRLPAPAHLATAVARYRHLGAADRLRAVRAGLALRRLDPADPALDGRTLAAWLTAQGQRPAAVAALWELIALPTLNLRAADASLALAVKVFRTGLLDRSDAADLGWSAVPLGRLHGDAATAALERAGAETRPGVRVDAVERDPGGGLSVVAEGHREPADAVVLAVPHDAVAGLLPAGTLADPGAPARLGTTPIVNFHVVYDRRVTGHAFAAGLGTPVQWLFDRTTAAGLDHGQYLAVSLSGADAEIDEPSATLRDRLLPALAELLPAARGARVEAAFVTRERAATFRQSPGTAALRPGTRTSVPGLYLAGAWTATGWPATMEGAVRSGLAAAHAALTQLGRPAAVLPPEVAA